MDVYEEETAVEDDLQRYLKHLDSTVETASHFTSCPTSLCTTASDIYPDGITPLSVCRSSESVTDEQELCSLNVVSHYSRPANRIKVVENNQNRTESDDLSENRTEADEFNQDRSESQGDAKEKEIETLEARVTPYQQSSTKRDIKKIAICRPPLWCERRVHGHALRRRAATPTKKGPQARCERVSRRSLLSPFERPTNSEDSYHGHANYGSVPVSRGFSSMKRERVQTPEPTVCSPSLMSGDNMNESLDEDHTKVGVPSLVSYSPSTETFNSSAPCGLIVSGKRSNADADDGNVEVHFGGGGVEVSLSIKASIDGEPLRTVAK
ncbi:hypothetical protein V3C99_015558 [Haemonchus contortus]|uniref:Uncharacterized protein n=1 Tax=Haemonchus contortus TaxID=6289 RepID=A0A7I4YXD1_HAECO|nr:unnamed protein product [Haemonchus contortus]